MSSICECRTSARRALEAFGVHQFFLIVFSLRCPVAELLEHQRRLFLSLMMEFLLKMVVIRKHLGPSTEQHRATWTLVPDLQIGKTSWQGREWMMQIYMVATSMTWSWWKRTWRTQAGFLVLTINLTRARCLITDLSLRLNSLIPYSKFVLVICACYFFIHNSLFCWFVIGVLSKACFCLQQEDADVDIFFIQLIWIDHNSWSSP